MDTENLVIGNKLIFLRHKVSSRAHSEKKGVFFFFHRSSWVEVEGSVDRSQSKESVAERKEKRAGKARFHSSSSSKSCVSFPHLESGGNSTRLSLRGCWTSKMTMGGKGFERTNRGYKGFIVLMQIAKELVINNTPLSQKVDVWSHNQQVCFFFFQW